MLPSNPYIETHSGKHVHFLDIKPDEINIQDIAFSLANQCRFNGHVQFFSVAEHSIAVAARLRPELQLAGLLHDAAEAYLSDIPSPIKAFLPEYRAIETKLQAAIYSKFGIDLSSEETVQVKEADVDATRTEAYYLLPSQGKDWSSALYKPDKKYKPRLLPPPEAVQAFLYWFRELTVPQEALARQMIGLDGKPLA